MARHEHDVILTSNESHIRKIIDATDRHIHIDAV